MSDFNDTTRDNRSDYKQDTILEHEYDGIQEFDNRLPNWWMWIMYGSIIFALFYWVVFHTLGVGILPRERFEMVMEEAAQVELARMAASGINDEALIMMSTMSDQLEEGRDVWVKHCVACHLDDGRGLVGPNMTDGYYIHGCAPMDMYNTVVNGVAAKGMPAWMNQLGPSRVQAVVAYVLTLRDTNAPNGKDPEGEPCEF